jgi:trigger factor
MIQEKTIEKLENSAVKLGITIGQDDVSRTYEDLVKKYGKSAQIKGFRKGKVPRDILERKFGEGFRAEALQDLIEAALREAFEEIEERPLPYVQPTLVEDELELEPGQPLSFTVTYDTFPEVIPGPCEGLTVTKPKVSVTREDEDREIEEMRQQNALVIEKEDGAVNTGDIVTITIEELDDTDQAVPDTRREDFTFTVGTDHNYYHIDAEITGMKKDETRIIEKVYPEDFEHEELKGETKRLRVTVTLIKERDVPDLDDEFAQDVSDEFETLDDLRKDLRKRLEANAERRVRSIVVDDLVKQILAESTIPVPESMVATELESSWRGMADQYRATPEQMEQLLAMQGKTKEDIFEDWKPAAAERLKRSLLVQKLIESEQVDVSDEEAESRIRAEAENRKSDPDQVLEYYKNNNMMSYVKREMAEDKLFDQLLEKNTVKAGKKQKYVDVMSDNG